MISFSKIIKNIKNKKISKLLVKDSYIDNNIIRYNIELKRKINNFISIKSNSIEISGSGGDLKKTFNISTSVFFFLYFMNIEVFKQGSKSYTSNSGSIDFLNSILNNYYLKKKKYIINIYKKIKFILVPAYLFYKKNYFSNNFIKYRKNINSYSIFNYTLPFVNPLNLDNCYCCISNKYFKKNIIKILKKNYKNFILVYSYDKIDEASIFNYVKIYKYFKNKLFNFIINANDLNIKGYYNDILSNNTDVSIKKFLCSILDKDNTNLNLIIFSCSIIMKFLGISRNYNNCFKYLKLKIKERFFTKKYIKFKKKIKCLSKK
ncbi:hypothetical protein [Candidatus Vidania fulgoroideorum]